MQVGSMAGLARRAALYGLPLAAGVLALEWLDYRRLVHANTEAAYLVLVAAAFLALGVLIGARLFGSVRPRALGNPQAQAALGISAREREVLGELAAGASNKEIARRLGVSPHTVKTHVSRLYEKLEARRRTDAVHRARELGLLP